MIIIQIVRVFCTIELTNCMGVFPRIYNIYILNRKRLLSHSKYDFSGQLKIVLTVF